jgi:hypothetical protein
MLMVTAAAAINSQIHDGAILVLIIRDLGFSRLTPAISYHHSFVSQPITQSGQPEGRGVEAKPRRFFILRHYSQKRDRTGWIPSSILIPRRRGTSNGHRWCIRPAQRIG